MTRNLFTKEFYQEVFGQIDKWLADTDNFQPEIENDSTTAYLCIEGDERFLEHPEDDDVIELDIECYCVCEWNDDSFDHAFGTWHDPHPYWYYAGIENLGEVNVYVNGKKVEGFDEDAFWSQFYEDEHGKYKKGDEVQVMKRDGRYYEWSKRTGTLLHYDNYHCVWAVQMENTVLHFSSVRHLPTEKKEDAA